MVRELTGRKVVGFVIHATDASCTCCRAGARRRASPGMPAGPTRVELPPDFDYGAFFVQQDAIPAERKIVFSNGDP
jgi:hypothetical protein